MKERRLQNIKLECIDDCDFQMRAGGKGDSFFELVESIRRDGVLVPILLHDQGDNFSVVAGHRRFAAAKELGLEKIPACIVDVVAGKGWSYAMAENLFRLDISPIEIACAMDDCLKSGEYEVESMARVMGRSVGWVRNCMQMVSWPEDLQEAVHTGKLSVAAASNLAKITERDHRSLLISYAIENGATARTTAAWHQAWNAGKDLHDPGTIAPVDGAPSPQPIVPWTPCVLCGNTVKMVELSYQPVCHNCGMDLIKLARERRCDKEVNPPG